MPNTYTTSQGDTWDAIAYNVYGAENQMGYLMQNNPRYVDYTIFPSGIVLNTPALKDEANIDVPDWRMQDE